MTDDLIETPARRKVLRRRNVVRRLFPLWRNTLPVYRVMDRLYRSGHHDAALVVSEIWKILTSIEIIPGAQIADDVYFVHGQGVVVGERTIIGRGTRILQQVTFGQGRRDTLEMPVVGEDVYIYSGAKLVGDITVGDHAVIAANAVVTRDVPAGAIVGGIPAKIIGWNDGFGGVTEGAPGRDTGAGSTTADSGGS